MKTPSIFHWPSPWLWGALGVLIVSDAHGFWDVLEGAAILTLIASIVFVIRSRFGCSSAAGKVTGQATGSVSSSDGLDQRLDTIERRLTDTQDVMIALSEKVDQWEAERSRDAHTTAGTP
jgi:hypothetical protein